MGIQYNSWENAKSKSIEVVSNPLKYKKTSFAVIPIEDASDFKYCSGCGTFKRNTPDNFNRDSSRYDGIDHICRKCRSDYRLKRKEKR